MLQETKKNDEYSSFIADSTTVSFQNYGYGMDQSEVKKRYTLKAQV